MLNEKIGLYIGNFDPIHIGDINLLQYAKNFCDRIWIIPLNRFKTDIPYEDRVELCTRMKNIYFRKEVSVQNYAMLYGLAKSEPLSYSDMVEQLYKTYPNKEFYYITDSKTYERIKTHEHPELRWLYKNIEFVVIGNPVEGEHIAYQEKPHYDLSWVTSEMVKDHITYNTAVPFITHAMYKYFRDKKFIPNTFQERLL
jgi:nicotinic acid mononucleotide adenylyltransferase